MGNLLRVDQAHSLHDLVGQAIKRAFPLNSQSVHWRVRENRVCLTGSVGSYYEKQTAQEALLNLKGVDEVINLIHVVR